MRDSLLILRLSNQDKTKYNILASLENGVVARKNFSELSII